MSSPRTRARAIAVTCLDAALVVSTAAALVVALGGRARFVLADTVVSLRGAANLAWFAAGFAALRIAIARRDRLFPAVPIPALPALDEERARIAAWERPTRRVWLFAAAALLGSFVWMVPHARDLSQVPDPGDPVFSAWRIAALLHQLATDPRHLWNGNIFYPLPLTITYSDSLFLQSLLAAPFVLAGVDPLVAANALMVISFPARGLAFFFLAWRVTGDPEAALIAAFIGAWSPFYPQHYSQLELNWTMFVPLALLTLLRALASPRIETGALFGAAVAAQCLACMYVAAMLVTFLVPFGAIVAIAWRVRPSRAVVRAAAGAALALLPVVALLGVPYMASREAHGERGLNEISDGSASPADYGDAHIRLATYQWQSGRSQNTERELFPGTSSLVLGAAGILPPLTPVAIATLTSGALAFDWSLGVKGLTYDDLYRRSPVYRGMRVPARFSAIVDAVLALLAAYGAARLLRLGRGSLARASICAVLAAAALIDLRIDPGLSRYPYLRQPPGIYAHVTRDMVLADLPRQEHDIDYMYFSTFHWAHLLGGYSGFIPWNGDLAYGFDHFPDRDAVERLRALGATHVTYNCAFELPPRRCDEVLKALAENPSLELVAGERWQGAQVALYRFR